MINMGGGHKAENHKAEFQKADFIRQKNQKAENRKAEWLKGRKIRRRNSSEGRFFTLQNFFEYTENLLNFGQCPSPGLLTNVHHQVP